MLSFAKCCCSTSVSEIQIEFYSVALKRIFNHQVKLISGFYLPVVNWN